MHNRIADCTVWFTTNCHFFLHLSVSVHELEQVLWSASTSDNAGEALQPTHTPTYSVGGDKSLMALNKCTEVRCISWCGNAQQGWLRCPSVAAFTWTHISNGNRSIPIMRSACTVYMAFTKVVSAHLTHLDRRRLNGRFITVWHFYVFDFNESPAAESSSPPAPSLTGRTAQRRQFLVRSYISPPNSPPLPHKQDVCGWECAAQTVESVLLSKG